MTPETQTILNEIVKEIEAGSLDEGLYELRDAVKTRLDVRISQTSGGPFTPGSKVRFKSTVRPAKLRGRTAVVVHTNGRGRNRIVVDLDQPVDRWTNGIRVSPAHVEPVAT